VRPISLSIGPAGPGSLWISSLSSRHWRKRTARVHVTIAQMMGIVLAVGLGLAALANANDVWASSTFTLAFILISAAILGGLGVRGDARMSWIGFAVFGWAYLLVSRLPGLHSQAFGPQPSPVVLIDWGTEKLLPNFHGISVEIPRRMQYAFECAADQPLLTGHAWPAFGECQPATSRARVCSAFSTGVMPKSRLNSRLNCDALS
jgi:hypothetical protein